MRSTFMVRSRYYGPWRGWNENHIPNRYIRVLDHFAVAIPDARSGRLVSAADWHTGAVHIKGGSAALQSSRPERELLGSIDFHVWQVRLFNKNPIFHQSWSNQLKMCSTKLYICRAISTYDFAIPARHGQQKPEIIEERRMPHQYQIDVSVAQVTVFGESVRAARTRARDIRTVHHEEFPVDCCRLVGGRPIRGHCHGRAAVLATVAMFIVIITFNCWFRRWLYHRHWNWIGLIGAFLAVFVTNGPVRWVVRWRCADHRYFAVVAAIEQQLLEAWNETNTRHCPIIEWEKLRKYHKSRQRTWIVISFRSHPSEFLALDGHIAQEAVRHHARIKLDQPILVAHARQIQTVQLPQHDIQNGRPDVARSVQAIGHRVRAARRYYPDRLIDSR